jgi:RNA polymerase sigma-70 factor (ECF subfamily)
MVGRSASRARRRGWAHDLVAGRAGDPEALGRLLEACRPYLLLIANESIGPELRTKLGGSDLVQETCLEAQRDFGRFRGRSEADLRGWLRGILMNNLVDARRHYMGSAKRRLGREVSLEETGSGSARALVDPAATPRARALARDDAEAIDRALDRLPEAQRRAIELRYREHLSFEKIGRRLGRSTAAARKLWFRAVERLQAELEVGLGPA